MCIRDSHGVDLHGDVILGDDGLGIEIRHLLLQAYLLHHTLNEGDLQMQAHAPHGVEGTQPLHHIGTGLLHHIDAVSYTHLDVYKRQGAVCWAHWYC